MQIKLCDKRLLAIKPPDFVSRQTRSLCDYKHWKGTCIIYIEVYKNIYIYICMCIFDTNGLTWYYSYIGICVY